MFILHLLKLPESQTHIQSPSQVKTPISAHLISLIMGIFSCAGHKNEKRDLRLDQYLLPAGTAKNIAGRY